MFVLIQKLWFAKPVRLCLRTVKVLMVACLVLLMLAGAWMTIFVLFEFEMIVFVVDRAEAVAGLGFLVVVALFFLGLAGAPALWLVVACRGWLWIGPLAGLSLAAGYMLARPESGRANPFNCLLAGGLVSAWVVSTAAILSVVLPCMVRYLQRENLIPRLPPWWFPGNR